jgi:hypothetical protein
MMTRAYLSALFAALATALAFIAIGQWASFHVYAIVPRSEAAALAAGDQVFMLHEALKPPQGEPRLILLGGSVSIDALPLPETIAREWHERTGSRIQVLHLGTYGTSLADSYLSLLATQLTPGSVVAVQVDTDRLLDLTPAQFQLALDRSLLDEAQLAPVVAWGEAHGLQLKIRPRLLRIALAAKRAIYLHRWVPVELRHIANDALAAVGFRETFACDRGCWTRFVSLRWSAGPAEYIRHGNDLGAAARRFTIATQISRPRPMGACRLACDLVIEMNERVRAEGGRLVLLRFPISEAGVGLYTHDFEEAGASLAARGIPTASFEPPLPDSAFKDALHLANLGRRMFLPIFVNQMSDFFE